MKTEMTAIITVFANHISWWVAESFEKLRSADLLLTSKTHASAMLLSVRTECGGQRKLGSLFRLTGCI